MAKYKRKPYEVDAVQWFKGGDHEDVEVFSGRQWLLRDFSDIEVDPGDWIVTDECGVSDCLRPEIFDKHFELVKE